MLHPADPNKGNYHTNPPRITNSLICNRPSSNAHTLIARVPVAVLAGVTAYIGLSLAEWSICRRCRGCGAWRWESTARWLQSPAKLPGRVLVGDVAGAAFLADRHIDFVPLLLRGAVGVLLEGVLTGELHHDNLAVTVRKLLLDGLGPHAYDSGILGRQRFSGLDGLVDLRGRCAGFPLDADHMDHRLRLGVGRKEAARQHDGRGAGPHEQFSGHISPYCILEHVQRQARR